MNRLEAAEQIAAALEDDYSTSVWSKGEHVRVYVTQITRKSKGRTISRDNGYIDLLASGEISTDHLDRQAGAIGSAIAELGLYIEPVEIAAVPKQSPVAVDEDVAAMEASERAIAVAELGREMG